jgi:hypothetical protein
MSDPGLQLDHDDLYTMLEAFCLALTYLDGVRLITRGDRRTYRKINSLHNKVLSYVERLESEQR